MAVSSGTILTETLLQACRQRAAGYDRENQFCQEDFDELKAAGYLKLTLPPEFGGQGYTLNQYTREARRLAKHAPATALCLNMHHYWVGTAADSWRAGDKSLPCNGPVGPVEVGEPRRAAGDLVARHDDVL